MRKRRKRDKKNKGAAVIKKASVYMKSSKDIQNVLSVYMYMRKEEDEEEEEEKKKNIFCM